MLTYSKFCKNIRWVVMYLSTSLTVLGLVLFTCSTSRVQQKSVLTALKQPPKLKQLIKISPPDLTGYPEISLEIFLRAASGFPMLDLAPPFCDSCTHWQALVEIHPRFPTNTPTHFTVVEHRPPPSVTTDSTVFLPCHVVLVMDVSGSMAGGPLEQAKQAALNFIRQTDAEIAIIRFETTAVTIREFTNQEDSLIRSIQSLKSGGGTRLYNALYQAIQLLQSKTGARHVVALTDGETGGDDYTLEEIIQFAQSETIHLTSTTDISIFPIGLTYQSENLQKLAQRTRGKFFYARDREALFQIFDDLSDSLKSEFYYEIRFTTAFPQQDGGKRSLHLQSGDSLLQIEYEAPLSQKIFHLSGKIVSTDSGHFIPNAKVITQFNQPEFQLSTCSNHSGFYQMEVPRHLGTYSFIVEGPPEFFIALQDTFLDLRGRYYVEKNFYLPRLQKDATLILWTVYFSKNEHQIEANSIAKLTLLSDYFRQRPHLKFEISGHTDSQGSREHNQRLSELRAQSVRNFFVKQEIPSRLMEAVGYGETKPLVPNNTPENRRLNRRVEIRLTEVE